MVERRLVKLIPDSCLVSPHSMAVLRGRSPQSDRFRPQAPLSRRTASWPTVSLHLRPARCGAGVAPGGGNRIMVARRHGDRTCPTQGESGGVGRTEKTIRGRAVRTARVLTLAFIGAACAK